MFINGKTNSFFQHTYLEMLSKDFKNFGVGKKYFYKLLICGVHQPTQKKEGFTMAEIQCFRQEKGSSNSHAGKGLWKIRLPRQVVARWERIN